MRIPRKKMNLNFILGIGWDSINGFTGCPTKALYTCDFSIFKFGSAWINKVGAVSKSSENSLFKTFQDFENQENLCKVIIQNVTNIKNYCKEISFAEFH